MLDDCERVSREVSALLDVEDPIAGEYRLEVSSPGLDRRFFSAHQCADFVGDRISVNLRQPMQERKRLVGTIVGADADSVQLRVRGELVRIPFASVSRARRLVQQ